MNDSQSIDSVLLTFHSTDTTIGYVSSFNKHQKLSKTTSPILYQQTSLIQLKPITRQILCHILLMCLVLHIKISLHLHRSTSNLQQLGISPQSLYNAFSHISISSQYLNCIVCHTSSHRTTKQFHSICINSMTRISQIQLITNVIEITASCLILSIRIGNVLLDLYLRTINHSHLTKTIDWLIKSNSNLSIVIHDLHTSFRNTL